MLANDSKPSEITVPRTAEEKLNSLGLNRNWLIDLLKEEGYLKEDGLPGAADIDSGYFECLERPIYDPQGRLIRHVTEIFVTPKCLLDLKHSIDLVIQTL